MIATARGDGDGPGPVTIGGLYRFFDDARGDWIEVRVAVDLARAIERLDRALAQRERRARKREVPFTDVDARKPEGAPSIASAVAESDRHVSPRPADDVAWEGRKLPVAALLGLGRVWGPARPRDVLPLARERPGDPWSRIERPADRGCPVCRGLELEPGDYCTFCDRSSWDGDPRIRPPSAAALRLMASPRPKPKDDNLAGGVGSPKNPPPRSKPAPPPPAPAPGPKPKAKKPKPPRVKPQWVQEYERLRGAAKGEP